MRSMVGLLLLAALLGFGCSSSGTRAMPGPQPLDLGEYRIQSGDELDIRFTLNPELNVTTVVRPDGKITLQLVDDVYAEGRTPPELSEQLRSAYSTELRDPEIAVLVKTMAARVYVDGHIEHPGEYPWSRQITAIQAIARAGGLAKTADDDQIFVVRRSADGAQQVIQIDLEAATRGKGESRDVYLAPYDIVYVPPSGVADVNKWVDQYIRQNIPVYPRDVMPGF